MKTRRKSIRTGDLRIAAALLATIAFAALLNQPRPWRMLPARGVPHTFATGAPEISSDRRVHGFSYAVSVRDVPAATRR